MGYIPKGKYETDLIIRTQNLIDEYEGKYDITLLMNCLLGLIVLPNETYIRRKLSVFNIDLPKTGIVNTISHSNNFIFNPTKWDYNSKQFKPVDKKVSILVKKIRNGIAHQRIEPMDRDEKWIGVKIEDIYEKNGQQHLELHIELTISELRDFALWISNQYLQEIKRRPAKGT